jgi:hypothetical protein
METVEAIKLIQGMIKEIPRLKKYSTFESKENVKWLLETVTVLEDIFGKNSQIVKSFRMINYQHTEKFEYYPGRFNTTLNILNLKAYRRGLEIAQGVLEFALGLLNRKGIDAVYEGKDTPKEASEILKILSLIENCLRKTMRRRPEKEIDIQDQLETLFIGAGLEFTREKERSEYSSKTYQPDFVFAKIDTVVEVKFCNSDAREKQLIGEINDYIVAFKTKYPNLIFVVYDLGKIRDSNQFKKNFEEQGSVIVKIIKH